VEFAALMVGPLADAADAACSKVADLNRPEIVTGAVVIRLEAGASAERIASIVCALAARS
jgi:transposase